MCMCSDCCNVPVSLFPVDPLQIQVQGCGCRHVWQRPLQNIHCDMASGLCGSCSIVSLLCGYGQVKHSRA